MLNLFQHPTRLRELALMKQPCVYILASRHLGTLYVGVTANLIESENPHWVDLAVSLGLEPLAPRLRPAGC